MTCLHRSTWTSTQVDMDVHTRLRGSMWMSTWVHMDVHMCLRRSTWTSTQVHMDVHTCLRGSTWESTRVYTGPHARPHVSMRVHVDTYRGLCGCSKNFDKGDNIFGLDGTWRRRTSTKSWLVASNEVERWHQLHACWWSYLQTVIRNSYSGTNCLLRISLEKNSKFLEGEKYSTIWEFGTVCG